MPAAAHPASAFDGGLGKFILTNNVSDDIIIVDCGVAFPEDDMLGIDLVIPDFAYLEKNKESLGYQADATIKTLLAFSCECYLKSMLISDGKNLDEIKKLGHGLSVLFTSLDSDLIGYIFEYMERNGYNIEKNYLES